MITRRFRRLCRVRARQATFAIKRDQTFARMKSRLPDESLRQAVQDQVETLWEIVSPLPMARSDHRDIEAAYEQARLAEPPRGAPSRLPRDATVVAMSSTADPR